MVLPGMREPLQPVPNPDIIAAARAAELAEGGEFERLAIKAANFSVFILLMVVLLFTMLTSGPDKKQKASKSAKTKDARYTAEEVAKHCTADDLWVIIKGKVYDVTSYVDEHPGGSSIMNNAGRDTTAGFYGPQHPGRVFQIMDDFLIGELEEQPAAGTKKER